MINVLITRSKKENRKFVKRIRNINIRLHKLNLIYYLPKIVNLHEIYSFDNIILSSKFSISILPFDNVIKKKNFWIVGQQSGKILLNKGCSKVKIFLNIQELFSKIDIRLYSKTIYLSGSNYSIKPPDEISHKIIYEISYVRILCKAQLNIFKRFFMDKILLFSVNSAKNFFFWHKNINFLQYLQKLNL